ncbi:hypothetical protein BH09VER1_BH09VER1_11940 [soil metagenome]
MKPLIKTLSILAIGGLAAGSAFAGPGDAHPSFAYHPVKKNTETVQIALFRSSAGGNSKVETKRLPSVNPKVNGFTTVTVTSRSK